MIYLNEIRDWMKSFGVCSHYYVGKLDNKKEKALGVYNRRTGASPVRAIGNQSSYEVKPVSLLIHWNKSYNETEQAAFELYKKLEAVRSCTINQTHIYILELLQSEPIDVGTDDNGVYERVIELNLFYERKK